MHHHMSKCDWNFVRFGVKVERLDEIKTVSRLILENDFFLSIYRWQHNCDGVLKIERRYAIVKLIINVPY